MILLHSLRAVNFKQFEDIEICFPEKGALLIEGDNEAGKSSLFEAVYFALYGEPLGELTAADLIRYGTDFAEATLEFSVDECRFRVSRRQGKQQRVALRLPTPTGEHEEKNGKREVDALIRQELGMSGAALLNTCFVEQKKLSGLESLSSERRNQTINELVNLTAFSLMEKSLPARADDLRAVETARKRVRVAALDEALPELTAQRDRLRDCHAAASLLSVHQRRGDAERERREAETERTQIADLLEIRRRQERAAQIRTGPLALLLAAEREVAEKNAAVRAAQEAIESLPDFEQRAENAERLLTQLRHGEEIEAEIARYAAWEKAHQIALARRDDCAGAVAATQEESDRADRALAFAERRDALRSWTVAENALAAVESAPPDAEAERLRAEWRTALARRESLDREVEAADERAAAAENRAREIAADRKLRIEAALATANVAAPETMMPEAETGEATPSPSVAPGYGLIGVGVLAGVAGPLLGVTALLVVALLLVGVGVALLMAAGQKRRQQREREAVAANERLRKAETAAREFQERFHSAQRQATEWRTEIETAEADARAARDAAYAARQNVGNADSEAGRWEIALQKRLAETDRARELPGLRQRTADAYARIAEAGDEPVPQTVAEAEKIIASCEAALADSGLPGGASVAILRSQGGAAKRRREEAQNEYAAALKAVTGYQPALEYNEEELPAADNARRALRESGLPETAADLALTLRRLHHEREDAAQVASELAPRQEDARHAEGRCADRRVAFWESVREVAPDAPPREDLDPTDALAEMEQTLREATERFDDAHLSLSPPELTRRHSEVTAHTGGLDSLLRQLTGEETAPRRTLELPPAGDAPLESLLPDLTARYPDAVTRPAAAWEQRAREADDALRDNRGQRRGQAESLGIADDALNLSAERAALQNAEFDRARNEAARDILAQTRVVILDRVLPATQRFASRILPHLTDNRYRELRWIADEGRVTIMDSRKGDFVAKRVFSGGARDQISLALRLAFALATLPGGKSVRPGWLFLDEPLSSFDEKRTRALVDLLSPKGLLGPQFPQIFLVSHSKSFDPERFPHRLELHEGRILSTTLPAAPPTGLGL